jgi:hypothetical protein
LFPNLAKFRIDGVHAAGRVVRIVANQQPNRMGGLLRIRDVVRACA